MKGIEKIKNKMEGMGKKSNIKFQSSNETGQCQISKFNNLFAIEMQKQF
jgi:hypothetical protein